MFPRRVGRQLAMLAKRQSARAALMVTVLHQVGAHAARQHPQTEARDFVIEDHLIRGRGLHALDEPLRQFWHSSPRSIGRHTDEAWAARRRSRTSHVIAFWTARTA